MPIDEDEPTLPAADPPITEIDPNGESEVETEFWPEEFFQRSHRRHGRSFIVPGIVRDNGGTGPSGTVASTIGANPHES